MGKSQTIDSGDIEERAPLRCHPAVHSALVAAARGSVGVVSLVDAQRLLRRAMFADALARTSGNRHAAARLLGVDRRYVTRMARESSEGDEGDGEDAEQAVAERLSSFTRPL